MTDLDVPNWRAPAPDVPKVTDPEVPYWRAQSEGSGSESRCPKVRDPDDPNWRVPAPDVAIRKRLAPYPDFPRRVGSGCPHSRLGILNTLAYCRVSP